MDLDGLRIGTDRPGLLQRDPRHDLDLDRRTVEAAASRQLDRLRDLQARLAAEHRRSVLLVLQGLDASGKDGTIRRVFSGLNPLGCRVTSFKVPNDAELEHDYLWRVHAACPRRGELGIFNRSHYEDVVTARVRRVIDEPAQRRRCAEITQFEAMLAAEGTAIVKVFLHISKAEQRRRLQARVDDPAKRWKFNRGDLETRKHWREIHAEYHRVLAATSNGIAPWWVVPADHKWARDHVVGELLVHTLESLDPRYPEPDGFDPATMRVD